MNADVDMGPLLIDDDDDSDIGTADEDVTGADSGGTGTADALTDAEDDTADVGLAEDAGGAVGAVEGLLLDELEPAVLVDDSGLVDEMDMSIAAADTVLSLIGITVAEALLPADASPAGLLATLTRDGEVGDPVGAVGPTGSFAMAGGTGTVNDEAGAGESVVVPDAVVELSLAVVVPIATFSDSVGVWPLIGGMSDGGRREVGGRLLTIDTGSALIDVRVAMSTIFLGNESLTRR